MFAYLACDKLQLVVPFITICYLLFFAAEECTQTWTLDFKSHA